jgi:hypothetical protein
MVSRLIIAFGYFYFVMRTILEISPDEVNASLIERINQLLALAGPDEHVVVQVAKALVGKKRHKLAVFTKEEYLARNQEALLQLEKGEGILFNNAAEIAAYVNQRHAA